MQQFKATLNQTVRRYTVVNNSVVRAYGVKYAGIKWRVGGIEDAPFTNLIYVRRNGAWTNLELSQYVEKNGTDRLITLEEINLFRSKQDALGFTPEVAGVAAQLVNALGYLLSDHTSDTTKHITTTERSNWNSAYNWGNHAEAGYLKSFTETDPVFMAWDKKTGILISKSQITDFPTSMPASDVYAWAKSANKPVYDWTEIISKPTKLSQFENDSYFVAQSYLNNYVSWSQTHIVGIGNSVVQRDIDGNIFGNSFNSSRAADSLEASFYYYSINGDYTLRKKPITDVRSEIVTAAAITNALGYTPGNISSITSSQIITALGYTPVQPTDARLTDSRSASDVYSWAKQSSKPSYSWTEIGSRPTNLSQFVNDLGNYGSWITASALSSYLLLSGGTMSGKILTPSSGTGTYGGAFEIREREYVAANQYDWDYAPRITFHWGNRAVVAFGLRYDGQMAVDGNPISMSGHTHDYATHRGEGTNYIDNSYRLYDNNRGGWRTSDDLFVGSSDRANYLPTCYAGGQQLNPQTYFNYAIGLKVAMTAFPQVWADTLWINGYSGGDVPNMCALHFLRNGQPRMYISSQANSATAYGTAYEVITSWNIGSQSVDYSAKTYSIYNTSGNYMHFDWSAPGGQTSYLWGISDGVTNRLVTPGDLNVNSANYSTFLNNNNYIQQRGSQGNWNQDFYNTPAGTTSYGGDVGAVQSSNPGGSWWIQQNFRHTNASNYWGVQVAWGWEDNANRLATRSISGGSFGAWNYYLHSNNFTTWAAPVSHSHDYATHRGEGTNYIDYARLTYNNGAYSGSGWCEPSDLGVRYASTAGYASSAGNAGTVGGYSYAQIIANSISSGVSMTGYLPMSSKGTTTFSSNNGGNGYLMVQYGTFTTNTTVSFASAFPHECLAVVCSHSSYAYYEAVAAISQTRTGFYGQCKFNSQATYIAIGY